MREKQELHRLLKEDVKLQREPDALATWIECAQKTGIKELNQFGRYLRSDWQALENALVQTWSNGLVEGHVNRIKVIKRQMYGRANFDLLALNFYTVPINTFLRK